MVFADREIMLNSVQIPPPLDTIKWLSPYYMSDHVYICFIYYSVHQFIISCVASSDRVGVLLHFLYHILSQSEFIQFCSLFILTLSQTKLSFVSVEFKKKPTLGHTRSHNVYVDRISYVSLQCVYPITYTEYQKLAVVCKKKHTTVPHIYVKPPLTPSLEFGLQTIKKKGEVHCTVIHLAVTCLGLVVLSVSQVNYSIRHIKKIKSSN